MSGKYDFKGIKKQGRAGLKLALSAWPYTAWLLNFGSLLDLILELLVNWLANRGLIVLNVGVDFIKGSVSKDGFDKAMDEAYRKILAQKGVPLTPEQIKAIDDEVIKESRKLVVIGKPN